MEAEKIYNQAHVDSLNLQIESLQCIQKAYEHLLSKGGLNLFQEGEVLLSSGSMSNFKIDCDALTKKDIECVAMIIHERTTYKEVYGVPTGGMRLAKALQKYCSSSSRTILVVDDVLTTGHSIQAFARDIRSQYEMEEFMGFVIFARRPPPPWVYTIFKMY